MAFDFSQLRVLVVDDNDFTQQILSEMLRAMDLDPSNLRFARDGADAFEKLGEHNTDLVFCDINMHPMNGKDFTRLVRIHPSSPNPFIPIIICTGHAEIDHICDARDAGANEILRKPVSADSVYGRLREVVEWPRPFIRSPNYVGPDRRRQDRPFEGPDRRAGIAHIG